MGKTLYLLRHAKSSWEDPSLADRDRPLAARGRRACAVIAEHLASRRIAPALVLCSPSKRTRETLAGVSAGFGSEPEVRLDEDLYPASAQDLLDRLRRVDAAVDSVMAIGHQPAIGELASSLALDRAAVERLRDKFPTAALATLAFEGSWAELAPGRAQLVAFVTPRELEGSRKS
jgi:phosphohistidine phosphatase